MYLTVQLIFDEMTSVNSNTVHTFCREPVAEDNSHSDKWGLRNLIPVLVVEVQKVSTAVVRTVVFERMSRVLELGQEMDFYNVHEMMKIV